jgi:hypothetical protein
LPNRLNIQEMRRLASSRGGECLSTAYVNTDTKLRWRCSKGHEWEATPGGVKHSKAWCPVCAGLTPLSLTEMQEIAASRGGECLSAEYKNSTTKLHWQCSKRHEWMATPLSVKHQKSWCPVCGGSHQLTLDTMRQFAEARGGKCLSSAYKNTKTKLRWRCADGHEWDAVASNVINQNSWCPKCAGKARLTLDDLRKIAASRGGKCLSTVYENALTNLRWRCAKGHEWEATPSSIKNGDTWCLICSGSAPLTLNDMKELAESRGGKCISETYTNSQSKLHWKCGDGHEWFAPAVAIRNSGYWCPRCSGSRAEELIRRYFELLFDEEPFPKCTAHPQLPSPAGRKLTLDGHSERLNLAFEYQGEQHYIDGIFGRPGSLQKLQAYDAAKAEGCRNAKPNPIRLVTIPYTVPEENYEAFIRKHCEQLNIPVLRQINIDGTALRARWGGQRLEELRAIAAARGGACVSEIYAGDGRKLLWRCAQGHEWAATPNAVKTAGTWCRVCSGTAPLTLDQMQGIAASRGGVCLSAKYVDSKSKLHWRCAKGHEWMSSANKIISRSAWCPTCAGNAPLTLNELRAVARTRGGECLSGTYLSNKRLMRWRCTDGHEWSATASAIKNARSWCPKCAGRRKLSLKDVRALAIGRGLVCLSQTYINRKTQLHWRCAERHEWVASLGKMKGDQWTCPTCELTRKAA